VSGQTIVQPVMRPIAAKERIEVLDVLRGFAIFGILLVNMAAYNSPLAILQWSDVEWWTGTADHLAEGLIFYLARGKFVTMFSFLFGLSFALFLLRAEASGAPFFPLYRRRLLALLLIGLLHRFFLWHDDILAFYAIVGFFLLLAMRAKARTVLILALLVFFLPRVKWFYDEWRTFGATPAATEAQAGPSGEDVSEQLRAPVEARIHAFGQGNLAEVHTQRTEDALAGWGYYFWYYSFPPTLAMFLFGLYVGRRRIFHDLTGQLSCVRHMLWWGLALGLVGEAVYFLLPRLASVLPTWTGLFRLTVWWTFGVPGLCFFYVAVLTLLFRNPAWRGWLAPLGAVGRTALSNYLLQSVICTTIFYSYGLGLYGKVGPALGLALTALIFALQIPLSMWWLRRFRFGPAEWLWRTLTYGRLQPMRVSQPAA